MAIKTRSPARLWVLLARQEPTGVIFRRGPSKQVMLIKWNTRRDSFEFGQWFKGRIYERRCNLSPDGELLIYFAAKQKPPLYSWTAISKQPYFTALALWPKGDCWNGGVWFVGDKKIRLNHSPLQAKLHAGFRPGPVKVVGYAEFGGEDATVWDTALALDGWTQTAEGKSLERGGVRGWNLSPPQKWRKLHPKKNLTLEMSTVSIGGRHVPWYQIMYCVLTSTGIVLDLGLTDWADWDHRGDLVFAKGGCLLRQSFSKSSPPAAVEIADFNRLKFEEVPPPAKAVHW